jgi:tetratricopeptide (TPR) repeat protein
MRALRAAGNNPAAAKEGAKLRAILPGIMEAFIEGGEILLDLSEFDDAESCFKEATQLFPEHWAPRNGFARTSMYRRDWAEALDRWRDFQAKFPNRVEGFRGLAGTLREAGEFSAADETHQAGMDAFPDDYWLAWGHVLTANYQQKWEETLQRCNYVCAHFPHEPGGYIGAAEAYRHLRQLDEARDALSKAEALSPGNLAIQKQLAAIILEAGDYEGALTRVATMRATFPASDVDVGPPVHGVLISHDPIIILSGAWSFEPIVAPTMAYYDKTGRTVHFLMVSVYSLIIDATLRERFVREAASLEARFKGARITFLANDVAELLLARESGLRADLLNNNAFVDENIYNIIPGYKKSFDAVYNARLIPYKRHYFAKSVESLILIVANQMPSVMVELNTLLPKAQISPYLLSVQRVVETINSAICGLTLSDKEGAMYASIECLLCGLPIVTTRNVGGRDWFFGEGYVLYADDTPESVAACVAQWRANPPSPEFVRENTMQRIRRERAVFFDMVERIFDENGQAGRRYEPEFARSFFDKWNYCAPPLSALLTP